MPYLINTTRNYRLIVGGKDVTDRFQSFQVSDDSVYRNGLVMTTGTVELSTVWNGAPAADYGYGEFRRGEVLTLEVAVGPSLQMHPRGRLRVLTSSYSPESESTLLEVGCQIAYDKLLDNFETYEQYAPFTLDPVSTTFEGLNGALASASQYIYQDSDGNIVKKDILDDGASFNSVRSQTVLSVSPLGGGEPIPDQINLSYSCPSSFGDEDGPNKRVINETTSYYYGAYPGITFQRVPKDPNASIEDSINNSNTIGEGKNEIPEETACGETPPPPPDADPEEEEVCTDEYSSTRTNYYFPAVRYEKEEVFYDGPAGQVSYRVRHTYAPLLEANQGYFADKYDYCRRVRGTKCNPSGACPWYGTLAYNNETQCELRKVVTEYKYGEANELIETIQDTYVTELSAAESSDWRSGTYDPLNGVFSGFNNNMEQYKDLFRITRVITVNMVPDDPNITTQEVTTWSSIVTRTRGLFASGSKRKIDALDGIETKVVNRTTTIASLDNSPERVVPEATATETFETTVTLDTNALNDGAYVRDESVPYPLLYGTAEACESAADDYGRTLAKLIVGDARGLSIGEALSQDVIDGWYPSRKFKYVDDYHSRTVKMRMDATSWAVDAEGAAFVTAGLWMSNGSGNYTPGDNLIGNALPDMSVPGGGGGGGGGNPTPPPHGGGDGSGDGGTDPIVPDEPDVVNYALDVNVILRLDIGVHFHGYDGIVPVPPTQEESTVIVPQTIACAVRGAISEPGGMVAGRTDGGLPLDFAGNIVVDSEKVLIPDLFA